MRLGQLEWDWDSWNGIWTVGMRVSLRKTNANYEPSNMSLSTSLHGFKPDGDMGTKLKKHT